MTIDFLSAQPDDLFLFFLACPVSFSPAARRRGRLSFQRACVPQVRSPATRCCNCCSPRSCTKPSSLVLRTTPVRRCASSRSFPLPSLYCTSDHRLAPVLTGLRNSRVQFHKSKCENSVTPASIAPLLE
ncbi:Protein of unknown function [Pyronema omphalodes CBS 100304]|uniref:Uncharacterized protein n=1 Tax=Pyronema omphalodes (strain CBS 100304) TaxID=1076935 RepID=U4L3X0_PYROM|nr:Protein of unknown function [Pyronema omphalodes CBS 100304]